MTITLAEDYFTELDGDNTVHKHKEDNPPEKSILESVLTKPTRINHMDIETDDEANIVNTASQDKVRIHAPATTRLTINLSTALVERLRNTIYWLSKKDPKIAINYLLELGLKPLLDKYEKENGGPFKKAEAGLKRGRRKI